MRRLVLLTTITALLSLLVAPTTMTGAATMTTKRQSISANKPCGIVKRPPRYSHVVWIILENGGPSDIGPKTAPYLNTLASRCGLATHYFAVSHPSLPNYIALTSGTTDQIADDGEPSEHNLIGPNIFSELGSSWRALEQSMPEPCDKVTSGDYAARHNPAVYYENLARTCPRNDVALSWPTNLRAKFTFVTPNICMDMHSCPVDIGDAWLSRFVTSIIESRAYQDRSLALFITFDENDSDATNQVPTIVVAPSVPRGTRVRETFTHYSLLRTTDSLLGLPFLGNAAFAASMNRTFNL